MALDTNTFGYHWNYGLARQDDSHPGPLAVLPEYYHLITNKNQKAEWVPVRAEEVPVETGLVQHRFHRPREDRPEPYVTPEDAW